MHLAAKRLLTATALLAIFALALTLRFYGMDWSFKDGSGYSFHPDERHYDSCASHMTPQWLSAEEVDLPLQDQIDLLVQRNLIGNPDTGTRPGLEPINYNYGTGPLHMYLGYREYLKVQNPPGSEINFIETENGIIQQRAPWKLIDWFDPLGIVLILIALWIGIRLFVCLSRDLLASRGKSIPFYKDIERIGYLFASIILPLLGLLIAFWLPNFWVDLSRYRVDASANILIIGRLMTAWCGALTVLVVYLLARDAYGKLAGLLAAMILTTAMLHVQTSHFATVDVILGFFVTCAIYAFYKASQTARFYWYFLAMICTGFAVGAKWSGLMLIGMLWVSHAIATLSKPGIRPMERRIHAVLLVIIGFVMLFFLRASTSIVPTFNIAIGEFWTTFATYWWLWILLSLLTLIASFVLLRYQLLWDGKTTGAFRYTLSVFRPWLWFLLSIPVGVAAFFIASPMAFYDAQQFADNLIYQTRLNGAGDFLLWYTYQYVNTPAVWYSLDNLFYPSLDYFTAFVVVAGCFYSLYRMVTGKGSADVFLCAWVIPAFIIFSSVHSKFPRYLLVVLPIMAVLGGRFLAEWIRAFPHLALRETLQWSPTITLWLRRSGTAVATVVVLCGLLYATAYVRVYDEPHTLVQMGQFVRDNIQNQNPPSVIAQNNVDEGPGFGPDIGFHYGDQVNMTPEQQVEYYVDQFSSIDYLVFRSKRPYGSTLQYAEAFPMINQMFQALFAEQLGFRVMKVITNPPAIGPFEFHMDTEDETARIYESPKVVIFEKIEALSKDALRQRISNPPNWVREITAKEILSLRDGYPVYAQPTAFPQVRWYIAVQALGLLAFLLMFPLLTRLPDRGWSIAKPVGIALFAWASWLLASIGIWEATFVQRWCLFILFALAALWVASIYREKLKSWFLHNWKLIVTLELLFLILFSAFLSIRMHHPASSWGEKPMNASFINASFRADTFPPEDPWYAGNPVNYYYYGHMLFSTVAEWAGIAPQYVINVAGSSIAALVGLAMFGLVFAFTQKKILALLGVYFALFLTPVTAFFQQLSYAIPSIAHWENLVRIFHGGIDSNGKEMASLPTFGELFAQIPAVFHWAYVCLLAYTGFANEAQWRLVQSLSYDSLFWPSRTTIPGTAANEYPAWTHLFLDFHAHMLVWPFTLAFLLVLYAFFSRHRRETNTLEWFGLCSILALLLGTITCTNTWDLPGAGIALILAMTLKFWRESDLVGEHGTRHAWLSPSSLQHVARLPIAPLIGIFVLSIILLFPFHYNFESRVSSIGLMTEGQTSPFTYFLWLAPLLFPLIAAVLGWAFFRPDGGFSFTRSFLFTTGFIASVLLSIFLGWFLRLRARPLPEGEELPLFAWLNPSEYYTLAQPIGDMPFDLTVLGLMLPLLAMLFFGLWNRRLPCSELFALLIGFIGLGLSLGIEIFHIKEGWNIPAHRWNTAFKFNLQVWMYLAIFAPVAILLVWRHIGTIGRRWGGMLGVIFIGWKRMAFVVILLMMLAATLPMTITAPALVMYSGGAKGRDALPPLPTMDGTLHLQQRNYGTFAAVHWLNRFVNGTPTILEMPDGYYNNVSRFSIHTGLPTVIGWAHHVGERIASPPLHESVYYSGIVDTDRFRSSEKYDRTVDADQIYLTKDKNEARRLLNQYDVEYVIFGDLEATYQRNFGSGKISYDSETLARLEQWTDLYELVFRVGNTSVFRVIRPLNPAGATLFDDLPANPASLNAGALPGVSMFEGEEGGIPGTFRQPRAITTDAQGYAYVVDTFNHRLQVFRPGGLFVWSVGEEGQGALQFKEPNAIDIDPNTGNLYIADTWNGRVVLLDKYGNFLGATTDIPLYGPRGIVFHPEVGKVFIADTGNHRVKVLQDGQVIDEWGIEPMSDADTDFYEPIGLDIDAQGNIVVCDTLNFRVKVYTPDGELLRLFPIQTLGTPQGGFESHLACAPDGTIYVTDPWEGSVHVYSSEGELLRKMDRDLRGEPLQKPVGITITPDERIIITDIAQNRIVAIQ